MGFVYVTEHGSTVGINGGNIIIRYKDKSEASLPKEMVEGIAVYSKSQITSQCLQFCFENNIKVSYFTSSGKYLGSSEGYSSKNAERIKRQFEITSNKDASLRIARKIINAKINNQLVVAKRYMKGDNRDPKIELFHMRNSRRKSLSAEGIKQLMGYEGLSSKIYFKTISVSLPEEYCFGKRMRPATDPVNAMLNFGYSMLLKEICGVISNRSMLPQVGFIHSGHDNCPALACDMIEEWRSVIVDSTVFSLITGNEISIDMFSFENDICKMNHEAIKIIIEKMERKMFMETKYLSYIDKAINYRQAIWHQVDRIGKVFDTGNTDLYQPIIVR